VARRGNRGDEERMKNGLNRSNSRVSKYGSCVGEKRVEYLTEN